MARGWESKAIESQIEAAETRASQVRPAHISEEQLKLRQERESIELSRTRVLQDLASTTNPRYRELLQRSLNYLDEKLRTLEGGRSFADLNTPHSEPRTK